MKDKIFIKKKICSLTTFVAILLLLVQSVAGQHNTLLHDFTGFDNLPEGWKIQGEALANPLLEGSFKAKEGTGILVGSTSSESKSFVLKTTGKHGDVAVEFDVLLSHRASGLVWLQGRYGLRLADSWKRERITSTSNGVIIPPKGTGAVAGGYLPSMSTARAPGTWQHIKIVFNAPQFGPDGDKIRKARFVSVEQNDVMVQENQYLSGVSKGALYSGEQPQGPLAFEVDKGHIAIKNIRQINFTGQHIKVNNLIYQLYMGDFFNNDFSIQWDWDPEPDNQDSISLPADLTGRQPDQQGKISQLNNRMTRGKGDNYALVFKGQLEVPVQGVYHFEVIPNGLGNFKLDGKEFARWDALHNKGTTTVKLNLNKGSHSFRLTSFNLASVYQRQPGVGLFVKGPGMKRQGLHEGGSLPIEGSPEPIVLAPSNDPLIQRSFMQYKDQRLFNCINVGSPSGTHYTFNLATGGIVQAWRGPFGDVTSMWHGRGRTQTLQPLGSVLALGADQQVLLAGNSFKNIQKKKYIRWGYTINNHGEPVFQYEVGSIRVHDHIRTEDSMPVLKRSLRFSNSSGDPQTIWYRLAAASTIEQISGQLYAIDGKRYFVHTDESVEPIIKQDSRPGQQMLVVPIHVGTDSKRLTYSVIW